jgi:hypothetical protein
MCKLDALWYQNKKNPQNLVSYQKRGYQGSQKIIKCTELDPSVNNNAILAQKSVELTKFYKVEGLNTP